MKAGVQSGNDGMGTETPGGLEQGRVDCNAKAGNPPGEGKQHHSQGRGRGKGKGRGRGTGQHAAAICAASSYSPGNSPSHPAPSVPKAGEDLPRARKRRRKSNPDPSTPDGETKPAIPTCRGQRSAKITPDLQSALALNRKVFRTSCQFASSPAFSSDHTCAQDSTRKPCQLPDQRSSPLMFVLTVQNHWSLCSDPPPSAVAAGTARLPSAADTPENSRPSGTPPAPCLVLHVAQYPLPSPRFCFVFRRGVSCHAPCSCQWRPRTTAQGGSKWEPR